MPLKKLSEGSKGGIKKGGVKKSSKPKASKPSSVTLNKKSRDRGSKRRAKLDGNSIGDINRRSKTPSQADFKKSVKGFGKIRTSSFSGNLAKSTNSQYHTVKNSNAYGGGSRKPQGIEDNFKLKNWGDSDIFL